MTVHQHHVDVAADELGVGVRVTHAGEFDHGALHHLETDLGVRHFAAAELEPHLDLVAVPEEFLGVAELGEKVAVRDARGELDLLDLRGRGLDVGVLLLLLVHVLAEVHDADYRWHSRRSNFNQIGFFLFC